MCWCNVLFMSLNVLPYTYFFNIIIIIIIIIIIDEGNVTSEGIFRHVRKIAKSDS
jgi:hypothetical protein